MEVDKEQSTDARLFLEIGEALIRGEHEFFTKESMDNSEHIPAVRRITEGIARVAARGIGSAAVWQISATLHELALDLFVQLWLQLAEEECAEEKTELRPAARRSEKARAVKEFERYWPAQ